MRTEKDGTALVIGVIPPNLNLLPCNRFKGFETLFFFLTIYHGKPGAFLFMLKKFKIYMRKGVEFVSEL